MSKIIVIGGGVSGLMAACILADQGHEVVIIEKNAYLGGRLHSEIWDNYVAETGATWLHDSDHPLKAALTKGGICQDYIEEAKESKVEALFNHYIGHRLLKKLDKRIRKILLANIEATQYLSWDQIIRKLVDQSDETPFIHDIRKLLNEIPYKFYINLNSPEGGENLTELLQEMDVNIHTDSVYSCDNYIGTGDEAYLPAGGLSQIVDHLVAIVKAIPNIEIRCSSQITAVKPVGSSTSAETFSQQVELQNELGETEDLQCDQVVFAIAPDQYRSIERVESEVQRTTAAVSHMSPSNRTKFILQCNKPIYFKCRQYLDDRITLFSQGTSKKDQSPIVYFLKDSSRGFFSLGSPALDANKKEQLKNKIQRILREKLSDETIEITKLEQYYPQGNSWFYQLVGFKPVDNHGQDIIYLGSVTGCDDSVHSVCSRACIELGVNPKTYIPKLLKRKHKLPERIASEPDDASTLSL